MRINSDYYIVGYYEWIKDPALLKAPHFNAWGNTGIAMRDDNNIVLTDVADVNQYKREKYGIWHVLSQIDKSQQADTMQRYTLPLCCVDIDDQALKPNSPLYDAEFDQSANRYALSNKILSLMLSENSKDSQSVCVYKSTKGYHIIAQFDEKLLPFINHKENKLTETMCNRYNISDNERERAHIDILLMHQIKMQDRPLKTSFLYQKGDLICVPHDFIKLSNSKQHTQNDELRPHVFTYSQKPKRFVVPSLRHSTNYVRGAFFKYLEHIGKTPAKQMSCLFHSPDKKPSMSIDNDQSVFCCHACGKQGNLTQFVALYERCSNQQANSKLLSLNLKE